MIGAAGMAGGWIRRILSAFPERVEVSALVDVNADGLKASGDFLDLAGSQRFTSMEDAFARAEADFAVIAIPPAFHEEAVMGAVRRGLPILSEKPMSDTWAACGRIYRAVTQAGLKMQVTQNYRFNAPPVTMRRILRSGDLGRINYLVGRFAADYRELNSWGAPFRHQIPHALLIEGGVHHFDMLRNLAGADVKTIAGWEWNPPWSSSKGAFNALYSMRMTNDSYAAYEGSGTAGGEQNNWHEEQYRVECEGGSVTVDRQRVVRIHRFRRGGSLVTEEVPNDRPMHEGHHEVLRQFLDWMDGGAPPETILADNIRTAATLFAAIEASAEERTVDVEAKVREVAGG